MRPADDGPASAETAAVDWDDVRGTLAGDGGAYERIVRRHQQAIAGYLWRFTRDRRQWEELVQDVFVEGYLSLGSYAGRAPLGHWLKRVATRVGYRFWKTQRRRRELPLPADVDALLAKADGEEAARHAAELVHELLARLGPRDRLVLTLTCLEECSIREAAELTGWSRNMVKVQSHRARKRLAALCREMGVEP
ncbi:MAG: RNA polymerase sigma factor [Thermoguttaceae bacterium]